MLVTTNPNNISDSLLQEAREVSDRNTATSQAFAREQMQFQEASNAKAMAFSAKQADINRKWETEMSNTAHQREIKDLMKAGLNPVLSVNKGASTPSGSSPSGVSSGGAKGDVDTGLTNMINNLLSAVIGQATALQTTSMNNQTSLEITKQNNTISELISKISANAMLGTANINAGSNQYMQKQQQAFEERMKKDYPQNTIGGISALWNNLFNGKGFSDSSAKSTSEKDTTLRAILKDMQKSFDNPDFGKLGSLFKK
jgi:hypothetical protein